MPMRDGLPVDRLAGLDEGVSAWAGSQATIV
jgi:hypothetical protein